MQQGRAGASAHITGPSQTQCEWVYTTSKPPFSSEPQNKNEAGRAPGNPTQTRWSDVSAASRARGLARSNLNSSSKRGRYRREPTAVQLPASRPGQAPRPINRAAFDDRMREVDELEREQRARDKARHGGGA